MWAEIPSTGHAQLEFSTNRVLCWQNLGNSGTHCNQMVAMATIIATFLWNCISFWWYKHAVKIGKDGWKIVTVRGLSFWMDGPWLILYSTSTLLTGDNYHTDCNCDRFTQNLASVWQSTISFVVNGHRKICPHPFAKQHSSVKVFCCCWQPVETLVPTVLLVVTASVVIFLN